MYTLCYLLPVTSVVVVVVGVVVGDVGHSTRNVDITRHESFLFKFTPLLTHLYY